ncbi:DEAD/DEAH box helicase [Anaerolineales bacterium HSG24]|nr:DEAD/DEAH box helicase [Anaerolineales bacterium HSG24]
MHDLIGSYQRLEEIYRMYIKSAFPLRYRTLSKERDKLLRQTGSENGKAGLLSQPPLLETIPVYPSSEYTLEQAVQELPSEYADLQHIAQTLFPDSIQLYKHQWDSLHHAIVDNKDIVVTTGTGSGKTEAFLLPLLAQLAKESATWSPANQPPADHDYFWWTDRQERCKQWGHISRPQAMRAIIMYPLNALIEDQLHRLRSTLDDEKVHGWLDQHRGGNRITYGRYNSLTPVPGHKGPRTIGRLRKRLKEGDKEYEQIQKALKNPQADKALRWYFANPNGGEMWSRWDMHETPPDILITNYSMLNIMMMRQVENNMFEQTRQWLHEPGHPERVFHLIIDELHAYRGTPGTEVAYIIRLLLYRLGLEPDSPKLRILTTSASLEGADGTEFLCQFFGRNPNNFEILSEKQESPQRGSYTKLATYQSYFADFAKQIDPEPLDFKQHPLDIDEDVQQAMRILAQTIAPTIQDKSAEDQLGSALNSISVADALRDACLMVDKNNGGIGEVRPALVPHLDKLLFPKFPQNGLFSQAMHGLLLALGLAKDPDTGRSPQPVRGHLFFHNLQNLWVCTNPDCTDGNIIPDERHHEPPTVGALHDTHRFACSCGARVLDFIVCEVCGEVFIGGYKSPIKKGKQVVGYTLTPDQADLEGIPDNTVMNRTYGDYAIFWPNPHDKSVKPARGEWTHNKIKRDWIKAGFDISTGRLQKQKHGQPKELIFGWWYILKSKSEKAKRESAMPSRCPRCDVNYGRRKTYPTPLRNHRTGFQKASQVLASGLMREMPKTESATEQSNRKLVIFSDSRQDAAKLAAGMERDHHRDLVRMALIQAFQQYWDDMVGFLRAMANMGIPPKLEAFNPTLYSVLNTPKISNANLMAQRNRFATQHQDILSEIQNWWMDMPPYDLAKRDAWESLLQDYPHAVSLVNLRATTASVLLKLGVNFAGAEYNVQNYILDKREHLWHTCFNWTNDVIVSISPFQEAHRTHINLMNDNLMANIMYVLFTHTVSTLEGLRQGWVTYRPKGSVSDSLKQATDATIRMLGIRRRHRFGKFFYPGNDEKLPSFVRKYLEQNGVAADDVSQQLISTSVGVPSFSGLFLNPEKLYLMPPPKQDIGYHCPKCHGFYLHPAMGICPECADVRLKQGDVFLNDYYVYLSEKSGQPFRMNAEELTGQTDKGKRVERQRWFQDIFLEDEESRPQGIDLLSVTTTMEAGVDIGALLATMMANMPPRRFNYQQRVGRAGRRKAGVSLAVTFCRGRSHDDFYYQRPEKMTGDPPPPPYVDMTSEEIIKRVLIKEVLRQAFVHQQDDSGEATFDSVHGEFGEANEWYENLTHVKIWLTSHKTTIQQVLDALLPQTVWHDDTVFRNEMIQFVTHDLVNKITEVADSSDYIQNSLSERLANAGLLPMFGFPTRVRLLHTRKPSSRPWPPETGVVDRNLDIAIGQFAPGSETIKDKAVHLASGVVEFFPQGSWKIGTKPGIEPSLPDSNLSTLGFCHNCRALADLKDENVNTPFLGGKEVTLLKCPVCDDDALLPIDAREPKGFFTNFKPRDFDGYFEWTPRSTMPSIYFDVSDKPEIIKNCQVSSFADRIISINDDGGKGGFNFHEAKMYGETQKGAYAIAPEEDEQRGNIATTGPAYRVALLAKRHTDIMLVNINNWPKDVFANPKTVEGRAAWYSFAFWLRIVAASHLDVDPQELQSGFRTISGPAGEAFLCDQLENGAGYCRYLSKREQFETLLAHADVANTQSLASQWLRPSHAHACDTSCNYCLRDYTNMPYHGLLDWRLALDMARLALGVSTIDLTTPWGDFDNPWQHSLKSAIPQTFAKLGLKEIQVGSLSGFIRKQKQTKIWIMVHPLWQENHPIYQQAKAEAQQQYPNAEIDTTKPYLLNPFRSLRRPVDYLS